MLDEPEQCALQRKRQARRILDRRLLDKRYPVRCSECGRRIRKGHNHRKPKALSLSLLRDAGSFNVLVLIEAGNEFEVVGRLFDHGVTEAEARASIKV